jgi:hypothetical protein
MTASTGKYRKRGSGSIRLGYLAHTRDGVTKAEHVAIAEKALGKPLPPGAIVHHADGNKLNNAPENLVVCPSAAYHRLIHRRMNALAQSGNANWRKCWICKQYDSPDRLYISPNGQNIRHHECAKRKESKHG